MAPKLSPKDAIDAAKKYRKKGWRPFPLPVGQKKPDPKKGWKKAEKAVTDTNIEKQWADGENIGVRLDAPLTDVDLDSPEAVAVASRWLSPTPFKFGRSTAGGLTHFMYECLDAEVMTFNDPVAEAKNRTITDDSKKIKAMLVEIRTGAMYTMVPPSVHPSGAQLKFGPKGGFPEGVLFADLKTRVSIVAAVALMVRYWPTTGGRNEATMSLCGGLVRDERENKIPSDLVEEIIRCVVEEGGNSDPVSDFLAVERTRKTFEKIDAGAKKKVKGWTSLTKLLGSDGKTVVRLFRDWLGILPKHQKRARSPLLDTSWADKLVIEVLPRGEKIVSKIAGNVSIVLNNDLAFYQSDDDGAEEVTDEHDPILYYDEFRRYKMVRDPLPWDHTRNWHKEYPRQWIDTDVIELQTYLAKQWGFVTGDNAIANAVDTYADMNHQHEVRHYLEELSWDKQPRLERLGKDYFDGKDDDYTSIAWKMWMISAVARVMKPGCQVDTALILEGQQGIGKSTALRTLCACDNWFTDSHMDMSSKAGAEILSGAWIVEIGELSAMRRADVETVKAFLPRRVDKYRPAYGRETVEFQRACVFAGTVNPGNDGYLKDTTGNRRFWPVVCGTELNLDGIEEDRDQLWAEAVALYSSGERWWLRKAEDNVMIREFERQQRNRRERGPFEEGLMAWLEIKFHETPSNHLEFTVSQVLEECFDIPVADHIKGYNKKNLAETIERLGIKRAHIDRARHYYIKVNNRGREEKSFVFSYQYTVTRDQMYELTDGDIDLKIDLTHMNPDEAPQEEDESIPF